MKRKGYICKKCGVLLFAPKENYTYLNYGTKEYRCPVCNTDLDKQVTVNLEPDIPWWIRERFWR